MSSRYWIAKPSPVKSISCSRSFHPDGQRRDDFSAHNNLPADLPLLRTRVGRGDADRCLYLLS